MSWQMWILAVGSGVLRGTLHEFVKGLKILVVVFTFPHGIIQPATSATVRAVYVRLADSSHSTLSRCTVTLASAPMASTQHDAAHDAVQLLHHSVATDAEIVADCFDPRINLSSCTAGNAQVVLQTSERAATIFIFQEKIYKEKTITPCPNAQVCCHGESLCEKVGTSCMLVFGLDGWGCIISGFTALHCSLHAHHHPHHGLGLSDLQYMPHIII